MHIKKLCILVIFLLFFSFFVENLNSSEGEKLTGIRYRCRIDSYNPLFYIWFFLFEAENREFLWQEKDGLNEKGRYHEIIFSNKSRVVANFFSQGDELRAMVDFGSEEQRGELNPKQTIIWFSMLDFSRLANPGDVYQSDYKTSENEYRILITAQRFVMLSLADKPINTLYFEGEVYKKNEKNLGVKFWISQEGESKKIIRCLLKKKFWPLIVIEIY